MPVEDEELLDDDAPSNHRATASHDSVRSHSVRISNSLEAIGAGKNDQNGNNRF